MLKEKRERTYARNIIRIIKKVTSRTHSLSAGVTPVKMGY